MTCGGDGGQVRGTMKGDSLLSPLWDNKEEQGRADPTPISARFTSGTVKTKAIPCKYGNGTQMAPFIRFIPDWTIQVDRDQIEIVARQRSDTR